MDIEPNLRLFHIDVDTKSALASFAPLITKNLSSIVDHLLS